MIDYLWSSLWWAMSIPRTRSRGSSSNIWIFEFQILYVGIGIVYQKEHEKSKKEMYEERVLEAEKGSFIPLIFTTSGGMGPLCTTFVQRLNKNLIAEDKKEAQSQVIHHIRTRLRFAMLKSTLIALYTGCSREKPSTVQKLGRCSIQYHPNKEWIWNAVDFCKLVILCI